MSRIQHVYRAQEGAVFVQVGIALFVLMAFNVFVLDYGMLWVARGQAQNAADAGALAGAVARGFDDFDINPHSRHSVAARSASGVAQANSVWQQPAAPVVSFDCPSGATGRCTTVAVFRDGDNGSTPLETLFGPMLGVSSQGVRATATAFTGNGNATPCLRPWAFADDWDEVRNPIGEFNHYDGSGNPFPACSRDEYTPPSSTYAGRTTVSSDFGWRTVWDIQYGVQDPGIPITRELVVPLDLPGGRTFTQNMAECLGQPLAVNQYLRVIPFLHPRVIIGDGGDGVEGLFNRDAAADYDYGNSRMINSCAPGCGPVSPRLMAIALYDPQRFQLGRATNNWTQPDVGCPTNHPCIRVTNIIGFFVHRITAGGGYGPHGHFLRYPGAAVSTAPTFVDDGSWLVTTHLIR